MKLNRITMATALVLIAASARASFDTGNDLYRFCTSSDAFQRGMCFGIISGYFENMHLAYKCNFETGEITRQQIRDVVVNALRDHPGQRHLPAYLLATSALTETFGCESWVGDGPSSKKKPANAN